MGVKSRSGLEELLESGGDTEQINWQLKNNFGWLPEKVADNARIHYRIAYALALIMKKPKERMSFRISNVPDNPDRLKTDEFDNYQSDGLDRFKGLLRLIRQMRNTGGNSERTENLWNIYAENRLHDSDLSPEDLELYLPFIRYLSSKSCFDSFYKRLEKKENSPRFEEWKIFKPFRKKVFQESIPPFWFLYDKVRSYIGMVRLILWGRNHVIFKDPDPVNVDMKLLERVTRELAKLRSDLEEEREESAPDYFIQKKLSEIALNRNDNRHFWKNVVNCCLTKGTGREAAMVYAVDRAVSTWNVSGDNSKYSPIPFGIAIFVQGTGHHISDMQKKRYLIFEGFPANQKHFSAIGQLAHHDEYGSYLYNYRKERPDRDNAAPSIDKASMGLTELVYFVGLKTAKELKIPYLFVNANHSGKQKSVEETIRTIALMLNLPQDVVWKMTKHRKFKLLQDPYTGRSFKSLGGNSHKFEYTHFLEKPSLERSVIQRVKNARKWHGEGYYDTWYDWNKFISETYPSWTDKMKSAHPYSRRVWKRAETRRRQGLHPESFWNLGIGYCKGFEIDVEKECARIGIK